jgi:hypothetical protein
MATCLRASCFAYQKYESVLCSDLKENCFIKVIEAAHSVIRSGKRGIFRLNKDQRFFVKHVLSTCLVNDSSQLDKLLQVYDLFVNDVLHVEYEDTFCDRNWN